MTRQRKRKAVRSMEEFERTYFPLDYAKQQREKRIAEVGIGVVMAEEVLERLAPWRAKKGAK